MGVSIPQVALASQDRASGSQVVGGSCIKLMDTLVHPIQEKSSRTEIPSICMAIVKHGLWSCWVKKPELMNGSGQKMEFFVEARTDSPGSTDANIFGIRWRSNGRIGVYDTE